MAATSADVQRSLQALSDEYNKIQTDLQTAVTARQRLETQQHENMSVQREFKDLKESANIYKLIGPVLVKQDKSEAVGAVDGRLNYIKGEITRVEQQIKTLQERGESKRTEIYQIQTQLQQQQQSQGQAQAT